MDVTVPAEPNFALELCARHVHEELWSHMAAHAGGQLPVFSTVYSRLIPPLEELGVLPRVLNHALYEWYLGNVTSDFIVAAFMPYVHLARELPVVVADEDRYRRCLSPQQTNDAFCTLYMLVHKGGVRCDVRDYYGHTPLEQLQELHFDGGVPAHLAAALPAFRALFRLGDQLAVAQQACVRRFLARRRLQRARERALARRRWAAGVIEAWWFDIVTCPDTAVGARVLKRRFDRLRQQLRDQTAAGAEEESGRMN